MPQVDKLTFLPIVFWTFMIYIGGFLFLNSTFLVTFLSSLKLAGKRTRGVCPPWPSLAFQPPSFLMNLFVILQQPAGLLKLLTSARGGFPVLQQMRSFSLNFGPQQLSVRSVVVLATFRDNFDSCVGFGLILLFWLCATIYWTETRPAGRPPGSGIVRNFDPFSKDCVLYYPDGSKRMQSKSEVIPFMSPKQEAQYNKKLLEWGYPLSSDARKKALKTDEAIHLGASIPLNTNTSVSESATAGNTNTSVSESATAGNTNTSVSESATADTVKSNKEGD